MSYTQTATGPGIPRWWWKMWYDSDRTDSYMLLTSVEDKKYWVVPCRPSGCENVVAPKNNYGHPSWIGPFDDEDLAMTTWKLLL